MQHISVLALLSGVFSVLFVFWISSTNKPAAEAPVLVRSEVHSLEDRLRPHLAYPPPEWEQLLSAYVERYDHVGRTEVLTDWRMINALKTGLGLVDPAEDW